jgi:hypothetical protein
VAALGQLLDDAVEVAGLGNVVEEEKDADDRYLNRARTEVPVEGTEPIPIQVLRSRPPTDGRRRGYGLAVFCRSG